MTTPIMIMLIAKSDWNGKQETRIIVKCVSTEAMFILFGL